MDGDFEKRRSHLRAVTEFAGKTGPAWVEKFEPDTRGRRQVLCRGRRWLNRSVMSTTASARSRGCRCPARIDSGAGRYRLQWMAAHGGDRCGESRVRAQRIDCSGTIRRTRGKPSQCRPRPYHMVRRAAPHRGVGKHRGREMHCLARRAGRNSRDQGLKPAFIEKSISQNVGSRSNRATDAPQPRRTMPPLRAQKSMPGWSSSRTTPA
jgi:hypothetical protein